MIFRELSAAVTAAAAAATIVCFAGTVSAKTVTVEIPLTYVDESGTALSIFDYKSVQNNDTDFNDGQMFTLDADSQAALASAESGDTIVITYDFDVDMELRYRHGFKIGDAQVSVNFIGNSGSTAASYSDNSDAYHLNTKCGGTANQGKESFEYTLTLGENGKFTLAEFKVTDSYGSETESINAPDNADDQFNNKSVQSISLNSAYRTNNDSANQYATLTNFKAVLIKNVDITNATQYSYTTDSELANPEAKGFTAEVTANEGETKTFTWYASNGSEWAQLGEPTTISGPSTVKYGAILYGLEDMTDITAGYSFQ